MRIQVTQPEFWINITFPSDCAQPCRWGLSAKKHEKAGWCVLSFLIAIPGKSIWVVEILDSAWCSFFKCEIVRTYKFGPVSIGSLPTCLRRWVRILVRNKIVRKAIIVGSWIEWLSEGQLRMCGDLVYVLLRRTWSNYENQLEIYKRTKVRFDSSSLDVHLWAWQL